MTDAPHLLDPDEIQAQLGSLSGWELDGDRLRKTFRFGDFAAAMGFLTTAGIHADKLGHHPEWSNVYNRVDVELTTHDSGGVTSLDVELASRMNAVAGH